MSVRADVAAVLARYDEDTWVAVANRGLLRRARKDLGSSDVRVVAEDGSGVDVGVGDVVVRIGLAGPGEATCTCPSPVTCQHVLTAGLWLASGATPDGPGGPARSGVEDLHAELMALDAATLTAHAGLPGYRWAHQLLDDTDEPPVLSRDGYLAVTFPRRGLTARYLGGGLDALVFDQAVPHVERHRVAVVLAWQRAHGLALAPPPPRSGAPAPSETALSRTASRERLRTSVAALLQDTVRVGVSHLSPAVHERLVTSAVWAQGVEYHRLALLLRRIADQVDLLQARAATADDLALLDDVAVAHALVSALTAAGDREPAALVGRARASYDPVQRLDLVGLGGRAWRSGSGYHGLTCVFWDTAGSRVLTWTEARPEGLAGFDPRSRWLQPAPWTGLTSPAAATGRAVALTQAQVSPDGRLSGVESTTASLGALRGPDLLDALPVQDAWRDLAVRRVTGLLDVVDQNALWTVLRPARSLRARWDPSSQTLRWAVLDEVGDVLVLEVPWSRLHAHVIGRIEAIGTDLPPGACVVARVQRVRGELVGEPLSLVLPAEDRDPVDALHFAPGTSAATSSLVPDLLAAGLADRSTSPDASADGRRLVPASVSSLRAVVEQVAQRGCSGTEPGDVHARIAAAHAAARAVGLAVFVPPDPALDPAELLLRSSYLVQQVEQALS